MNYKVYLIAISLNTIKSKETFEHHSFGMSVPEKIMEGIYIIKAHPSQDSINIRDSITFVMGQDCEVFVTKMSTDTAWHLSEETDKWLKENV